MGQKQIVVVDNNHDLLDEMSEFLEACGLITHPHTSPFAAMSFMLAHDFDVLLTDVEMPEMRGTRLAAWLSNRRSEIPIILISGLSLNSDELRDGWLFMQKPISLEVIQQMIESSECQTTCATGLLLPRPFHNRSKAKTKLIAASRLTQPFETVPTHSAQTLLAKTCTSQANRNSRKP